MNPIDLRSDTVTCPTAAMRRAMAEADVGDDVLDGDPPTRRLEVRVAPVGPRQLRAVIHLDVTRAQGEQAADVIAGALR